MQSSFTEDTRSALFRRAQVLKAINAHGHLTRVLRTRANSKMSKFVNETNRTICQTGSASIALNACRSYVLTNLEPCQSPE